MLADHFATESDRLALQAGNLGMARAVEDSLIESQFSVLNARFVTMVGVIAGQHTRLSVNTIPLVDTITTRSFTTLNKTVVEMRSTLYGPLERLTFTPALCFIERGQFGVIRLDWEGAAPTAGLQGTALPRLLGRGVVMYGLPAGRLAVSDGTRFETLTAEVLEAALVALFIHGS
jgi:hypothetical protein